MIAEPVLELAAQQIGRLDDVDPDEGADQSADKIKREQFKAAE